jgi:hypothetical protein
VAMFAVSYFYIHCEMAIILLRCGLWIQFFYADDLGLPGGDCEGGFPRSPGFYFQS